MDQVVRRKAHWDLQFTWVSNKRKKWRCGNDSVKNEETSLWSWTKYWTVRKKEGRKYYSTDWEHWEIIEQTLLWYLKTTQRKRVKK